MSDKTGKVGGKGKISSLDKAREAQEVHKTSGVEQVSGVQKAGGVGGVSATRATGLSGKALTIADKQRIHLLVEEEAEKMFSDKVPSQKKELLKEAVKRAIESGLIDEGELAGEKK
jgi:hypothetical protein